MKRDVFGGGQPAGLAAASARGRRPPKAVGGPTKYHRLAFKNSLHGIGVSERMGRRGEALREVLAVRMGTSLFDLGYLIHPIDFGA